MLSVRPAVEQKLQCAAKNGATDCVRRCTHSSSRCLLSSHRFLTLFMKHRSLFVVKQIFKRLYLNTNNPLCNMQSKAQRPSCLQHIVFDMQFLIVVNQAFAAHTDL